MPASGGGFIQGYNAQACVDSATLLIVASFATQQPNDKQQLEPALKEELSELPEALGKVTKAATDTGYYSPANVEACETAGIEPHIAVGREEHNQSLEQRFSKPEPLPKDADAVTRMKHRLTTAEGKATYAKRKCTVEPVFGIIKSVLGHRQFLRRGYQNAQSEWTLISMAWNLKRMHVLAKPRPKTAESAAIKATVVLQEQKTGLFQCIFTWKLKIKFKMIVQMIFEAFISIDLFAVRPTG
jgi:hypothetical protein